MGEPFENSEAWKSARVLTNQVYTYCRREPLSKDFGLRDQLQRAAVSVMNNVAEGWESLNIGEKRQALPPFSDIVHDGDGWESLNIGEKRQAYNIARRSCGEVRSMSYVLLDNKFVSPGEQEQLLTQCIQSGKLISGLIRSMGDRT